MRIRVFEEGFVKETPVFILETNKNEAIVGDIFFQIQNLPIKRKRKGTNSNDYFYPMHPYMNEHRQKKLRDTELDSYMKLHKKSQKVHHLEIVSLRILKLSKFRFQS